MFCRVVQCGMGIKANTFFKQLADKLLVFRKSGQRYSEAITFIRKTLRFYSLLDQQLLLLGDKKGSKAKIADLNMKLEPVCSTKRRFIFIY